MNLELKGKMHTVDVRKCYEENKRVWPSDPIQTRQ